MKIGDKPIEFIVDMDPTLPKYVIGDMIRVKQVLLNIIGNATKFTSSGYIKFGIHTEYVDGKLLFTMPIEDTGIGIEKKDLERLFVSFNQVDTHKNHSLEGTGLGLVISKRLCEMMGGDITVASSYGKGSTFTIRIKQTSSNAERILHISKPNSFKILLMAESDILREHFSSCMDNMKLSYDACADYDTLIQKLRLTKYTHVLVGLKAYKQLLKDEEDLSAANFVVLLNLKEQTQMDHYKQSIITSLFTMQLAGVLSNRVDHPYLLKRSGIDVLAIQPMPFVDVLIVDDNEVNLQVAKGLMTPYHMRVDCALSGQKAIDLIERKNYDLVFMDHMMPEMDGVEAVGLIRALPDKDKKDITIVALTANATPDAKDLFMEAGFNDFLSKPIETVKLNAILKKWLVDKNAARAADNPDVAKSFQKKFASEHQSNAVRFAEDNFGGTGGVNFDVGIQNLGNSEVYYSILSTYCRSAREKLQSLPELLETDLAKFTIEIHGLKGASGGICAYAIAAAAAELERLSKENQVDKVREELPEFLKALTLTLQEIDVFIKKINSQTNSEEIPSAKEARSGALPLDFLLEIKNAFLDFDSEGLKRLLSEQDAYIYDEREENFLQEIRKCYDDYDFEQPIQLIDEYTNIFDGGERGE